MRINHNLTAINTHRQMGISELDGSKSMEKLSSGFRINRAGDDAAGLAISEKMRGQVRGLTMASKNSSDTISLIQTAEGALAETHSILQRMRELSVQSANDTNTDKDREELQAEVTQLKAEIDRIGNTTEFNTKKLLEGSATGVRDEIVGTLRINNNSSLVIDANMEKAMSASISADKSWAFDGAYMLVKVNQSFQDGAKEFKASDYNLVGPDGSVYKFQTYTPDTQLLANKLDASTIIAEGGRVQNIKDAGAIADGMGADATDTVIIGAALTNDQLSKVGAGSVLVAGSTIQLDKTGELTLGADYVTDTGVTKITNDKGVLKLLSDTGAELGKIEVGKSATLNNGVVIKNSGDGNFSIENGSLAFVEDLTTGSGGTVKNFSIAAQSTVTTATTETRLKDTDIVLASNILVQAGTIDKNITIGNNVLLTASTNQQTADGDISLLKSGSVLAKGSTIQMIDADDAKGEGVYSIKIEVKGKEVEISYDTTNGANILKVGGETVAAGKSITLEDGTVLKHNAELATPTKANGVIFVEQGRVTLAEDINAATVDSDGNAVITNNVKNFTVAKDSTIMAGTELMGTTETGGSSSKYPSRWDALADMGAKVDAVEDGNYFGAEGLDKPLAWNLLSGDAKTAGGWSDEQDYLNADPSDQWSAYEDEDKAAWITANNAALKKAYDEDNPPKETIPNDTTGTTKAIKIKEFDTDSAIATVGNNSKLANGSVIHLEADQSITIGGVTYTFTDNGTDKVFTRTSGADIDVTGGDDENAVKGLTFGDGTITVTSDTPVTIAATEIGSGTDPNTVTQIEFADGSTLGAGTIASTTDIEVDVDESSDTTSGGVRLMAGSVISTADKSYTGSVTFAAGGKSMQFSANTGDALKANLYDLSVTDSLTFIFTEYDAPSSQLNDSLMSQIGANSGQTTFLSINDMRCKALGVDKIDISTKWGAATAIETVNNALQKVSHQRSSLGALQNRLEHTIKNLDTAAENIQAAESRIRDVDMAKEVMEFTRNNILQQASQAMLAQANQQPQQVLSLLR